MLSTHYRKQNLAGRLAIPVFSALVICYFVYHAFNGHLGVRSRLTLETKRSHLENELAVLKKEREALVRRVALIKPGSLEQDMVDERARYNLELIRGDEVVILLPPYNTANLE